MASTAASRPDGVTGRIHNAASTLYQDFQSLIGDTRKSFSMMKEIAVEMERHNETHKVKELENAVAELAETLEKCTQYTSAIESVKNAYQPVTELTDFKKLLEEEMSKLEPSSSSAQQNHPLIRQFREAIWNVHHAGQPMPGEEQEDIIMTSTQSNILNVTCPLTGKPVVDLAEPVRNMECKHIYDKNAINQYIRAKNTKCPVTGCPKMAIRVVCDPLLHAEIDELRTMSKQTARPGVIEDFTGLDEE
ncbi:zf-Nse domain-containing protein [Cephalotus follicularis]|uniref:Zf-Nse domain-containing protein n=1 Tax=Cephalotus follicularis TaxID=3775 RepID=A0A1Q3B7D1_CEPFO|nr:zf-Nse domain-containing protein [Cephalotus follicularis]